MYKNKSSEKDWRFISINKHAIISFTFATPGKIVTDPA